MSGLESISLTLVEISVFPLHKEIPVNKRSHAMRFVCTSVTPAVREKLQMAVNLELNTEIKCITAKSAVLLLFAVLTCIDLLRFCLVFYLDYGPEIK